MGNTFCHDCLFFYSLFSGNSGLLKSSFIWTYNFWLKHDLVLRIVSHSFRCIHFSSEISWFIRIIKTLWKIPTLGLFTCLTMFARHGKWWLEFFKNLVPMPPILLLIIWQIHHNKENEYRSWGNLQPHTPVSRDY